MTMSLVLVVTRVDRFTKADVNGAPPGGMRAGDGKKRGPRPRSHKKVDGIYPESKVFPERAR